MPPAAVVGFPTHAEHTKNEGDCAGAPRATDPQGIVKNQMFSESAGTARATNNLCLYVVGWPNSASGHRPGLPGRVWP
jgi:hypothetical protein